MRSALEIRDANLIAVASMEQFARDSGLPVAEVARLFQDNGVFELLRDHYDVLHTQPLSEGAAFARDYLNSRGVNYA